LQGKADNVQYRSKKVISHDECKKCCLDQVDRLAVMLGIDPSPVIELVEKEFKKGKIKTAPEYAELIFKTFHKHTGILDPYEEIKRESTYEAQRLLPMVEKHAGKRYSGLQKLIEMAIVGNMIDYGAFHDISIEDFIIHALNAPYFKLEIDAFSKDLKGSKKILYIADNAGEIVFDAILIEKIKKMGKDITVAVRGEPIINDVTYQDAVNAGIDKHAKIISTGARIPGIILDKCSKEFIKKYNDADLVIAKGQGNFETLYFETKKPKKLYYLFVVKCNSVARLISANVKEKVLMKAI
jgi:damage-control phosphatase, subfamily I